MHRLIDSLEKHVARERALADLLAIGNRTNGSEIIMAAYRVVDGSVRQEIQDLLEAALTKDVNRGRKSLAVNLQDENR